MADERWGYECGDCGQVWEDATLIEDMCPHCESGDVTTWLLGDDEEAQ